MESGLVLNEIECLDPKLERQMEIVDRWLLHLARLAGEPDPSCDVLRDVEATLLSPISARRITGRSMNYCMGTKDYDFISARAAVMICGIRQIHNISFKPKEWDELVQNAKAKDTICYQCEWLEIPKTGYARKSNGKAYFVGKLMRPKLKEIIPSSDVDNPPLLSSEQLYQDHRRQSYLTVGELTSSEMLSSGVTSSLSDCNRDHRLPTSAFLKGWLRPRRSLRRVCGVSSDTGLPYEYISTLASVKVNGISQIHEANFSVSDWNKLAAKARFTDRIFISAERLMLSNVGKTYQHRGQQYHRGVLMSLKVISITPSGSGALLPRSDKI